VFKFFFLGNIEDQATRLRTLATQKKESIETNTTPVDQNGNRPGIKCLLYSQVSFCEINGVALRMTLLRDSLNC